MVNEVNDQADQLKKIFAEVEQHRNDSESNKQQLLAKEKQESDPPIPKIDVLNLPPRSTVHGDNKRRVRLKIDLPFLRLLLVTLIMVILVLGVYIFFSEELIAIIKNI